ncbi:unnamed protein product, partial [Prorocentrum cordatum]
MTSGVWGLLAALARKRAPKAGARGCPSPWCAAPGSPPPRTRPGGWPLGGLGARPPRRRRRQAWRPMVASALAGRRAVDGQRAVVASSLARRRAAAAPADDRPAAGCAAPGAAEGASVGPRRQRQRGPAPRADLREGLPQVEEEAQARRRQGQEVQAEVRLSSAAGGSGASRAGVERARALAPRKG